MYYLHVCHMCNKHVAHLVVYLILPQNMNTDQKCLHKNSYLNFNKKSGIIIWQEHALKTYWYLWILQILISWQMALVVGTIMVSLM